jgi:hypothetical protein
MNEDLLLEYSQQKALYKLWDRIKKENDVAEVSRVRKNVIYRHSFLVSARKNSTLSLSEIGRIMNKDHATVLHACKQHDTNYRFDINYKSVYYIVNEMVRTEMTQFNVLGEDLLDENLHKNKDVRNRMMKIARRNRELIVENQVLAKEIEALRKYSKEVSNENSALRTKISSVAW